MTHADLAQAGAVVGAAGTALVLLTRGRVRLLGGFALLAGAEACLALALVPRSDLERLRGPLHAAALALAVLVILGLAAVFVRRPAWSLFGLLLAAPFRASVTLGHQHAFLLLPLYGVLAAVVLAFVFRLVRGPEVKAIPVQLAAPLAAFMTLDALSLLWSHDLKQGSIELVFFLFPFAALVAVVARADWEGWLVRPLAVTLVGLTVVFALIGLYQRATHTLFYAPSLEIENAYTSYFRVSSVFKDPSLFGRYLAIGIAVVVVAHLLNRLRIEIAAALLAVLGAALWFTYSQSSFAAVFVVVALIGLVVADRRARRIVAVATAALAIAGAVVVIVHVHNDSARRFTSDRSRLVGVTWRVIKNHPLVGVGVGGQPRASHEEGARHLLVERNKSHTTPLTVAAELGAVGFLAYLGFLAAAAWALWTVARRQRALGLGLAAVSATLFVHSLAYAGFFEDPLTWGVLAVAAAALTSRAPLLREGLRPAPAGPDGRLGKVQEPIPSNPVRT